MLFDFFLIFQSILVAYLILQLRNFKMSVKKSQHKSISLLQLQEKLMHSLYLSHRQLSRERTLPPPLAHVPWADKMGIVLSVKQITIPSVDAPYNASIGPLIDGHYPLFFRYDTPGDGTSRLFSHIGCIRLTPDFEPLSGSFVKIDTKSTFSEDARLFQHNGRQFLVYNDLIPSSGRRGICIAAIDTCTGNIGYITPLDASNRDIEKNWTPFSYENQIQFLYTICPQKVLELHNPQKNLLKSSHSSSLSSIWPAQWGRLKGGTPAIFVDGEYLAMFHSSFADDHGVIWYVMGAYTFASSPPFQIKRISAYPILFQNIYDIAHSVHANPKIRAIYPAGLICEKRGGRDIISVSCGENDSAIKIISMDKAALLASLRTVL